MPTSSAAQPGLPNFVDFVESPIVSAIKALYHIGCEINAWLDEHIQNLKKSDNPVIAATGKVLEGAKFGFGVGYAASVALIAVGQFLLGNTFAAVSTVASAAALSNPIAMTCAATGAIYFGWKALSDKEREQILDHLAGGLNLGVELIRAVLEFAIRKSRELLDSSQLEAAKKYIKAQAGAFGRTLYDVTRQLGDLASDSAEVIVAKAEHAAGAIKGAAKKTGEAVAVGASSAREAIGAGLGRVRELAADAVNRASGPTILSTVPIQPSASTVVAPLRPERPDSESDSAPTTGAAKPDPQ